MSMHTLCFGMPPVVDEDGSGGYIDEYGDEFDDGEDGKEDDPDSAGTCVQYMRALVLAPVLVLLFL